MAPPHALAVVAGLAASEYFSDDPNHIGYIQVTQQEQEKGLFSPKYVPYEWFYKDGENGDEPLLLLWLDDDAFKQEKGGLKTLEKLAGFVKLIDLELCDASFRLNILGPWSSTTLKYMTEEMLDIWRKPDKTSEDILNYMSKIAFYSPNMAERYFSEYFSVTFNVAQLG